MNPPLPVATHAELTWDIGHLSSASLTWGGLGNRGHSCSHCGIVLLTGEKPGFCCGPRGSHLNDVQRLPPLPHEFNVFLHDPWISSLSRILNLGFSFASLETTADFPSFGGATGFFAIQGKVYHRVRPSHSNSAVKWLLYDGFLPNNMPFGQHTRALPLNWITATQLGLMRVNPFVLYLRVLSQIPPTLCPNAHIIIEDSGSANEIAAMMSYDNTAMTEVRARRLVIMRTDQRSHAIPTVSRLWEPLAYPLFFPSGSLGWGVVGGHAQIIGDDGAHDNIQSTDRTTTQIWYYRALLLREERFRIFGHLTNEYLVDMFSRNLECRLNYIRENQHTALADDAQLMGVPVVENTENIYLPSSFLGSNRWASEQIADSLAIAAQFGPPSFFITVTCNPNWPEIQSQLLPGQQYTDAPLVVVRVFKQKLNRLEHALKTMFPHAGPVLYLIHSIEFQKRGLPHAHILVKYSSNCTSPTAIDSIISAEMPQDEDDAALVREHMLHNHPPSNRPMAKYCQREDADGCRTCRFHYPQPVALETSIDHRGHVHYRRRSQHDAMVVAHCLPLLRIFRCHMNFEAASSSHLFQYLFKYIHKGLPF